LIIGSKLKIQHRMSMKPVIVLLTVHLFSIPFFWNSFGQVVHFELINWNFHAKVDAPVFDSLGIPLEGPRYRAELWGGPTPATLSPATESSGGGNRLSAAFLVQGYFRGRDAWVISGRHGAWLQIRVWDTYLGNSYEEVVLRGLGGYGESPLFSAVGTPNYGGVPSPPAALIGLQSFRLRPATAVLLRGIRLDGDQVIIEWVAGFTHSQLQESSRLGAAWKDAGAPTTASSMAIPISGKARFFRVIGHLAEVEEINDENESAATPPE
jgi:hypothetical protein